MAKVVENLIIFGTSNHNLHDSKTLRTLEVSRTFVFAYGCVGGCLHIHADTAIEGLDFFVNAKSTDRFTASLVVNEDNYLRQKYISSSIKVLEHSQL